MPTNLRFKPALLPASQVGTRALFCVSLACLTACAALARQSGVRIDGPRGMASPTAAPADLNATNATYSLAPYPPERKKFWSFQPVKNPALPAVKNLAWCKTPIDRFILAGLEAKGLKPAPQADRRTLIRRATFDLTGLPPTPEETDAFVADKSPDAWSKVVDRLLASPRYGERWARRWLDIVRYADSYDARGVGGEGDISEAWRYRDWVVSAFNNDLPYNHFIKYQIAGDLLDAQREQGTGNRKQKAEGAEAFSSPNGTIATGLLAIGNWGNGDADKEKILTDIADDQLDVVSRSMMGLTVACARCHDHKFDPIPTKDYYGMAGIFFSSHILPRLAAKGAGENPLRIPLLTARDQAQRDLHARQLKEAQTTLAQERHARLGAQSVRLLPQTAAYIVAARQYEQRPASQSALSPDAFAQSRGLQAWALRQWRDALGLGDYTPLTKRITNVGANAGVSGWQGQADCPNLLVNTTSKPHVISTLTLPPRSVAVHPGPHSGVVVAWRSPISGMVRIQGRVADADPNGGDGIAWAIDQRLPSGRRELASGAFPNGGVQGFEQGRSANALLSVPVRAGERIELVVLPKDNYTCDTTVADLTITEQNASGIAAQGRVWNLANDVVSAASGGGANPGPDGYGHASVWAFEDTGERTRLFAPMPTDTPNAAQMSPQAQWQRALLATPHSPTELVTDVQFEQAAQMFAGTFRLVDERSPFWMQNPNDEAALPPAARSAIAARGAVVDALQKNPPPPIEYANGIQEGGVPDSPHAGIHDVRVHIRGSYARLGDLVPRHFPVVLAGETQPLITQGSGRLQFAEWLASAAHPLTARVYVNRIWQGHFGQGLVRTPGNFGLLGERPTHPEMLDWLAWRFVQEKGESGKEKASSPEPFSFPLSPFSLHWSTKKLHRLILLSSAYQQSSETATQTVQADPDNRLIGRMTRSRLEAEALRDSLLMVAGRLDTTMGGRAYPDADTPRRSLYHLTIRSDRSGFGPLFDGADPTACVDRRTVSTVAPQSLYLLNSPFALAQTQALAARLKREVPDAPDSDASRIRRAYRLLYARDPDVGEVRIGLDYLKRAAQGAKDFFAWDAYCQILLCANEFVYVD